MVQLVHVYYDDSQADHSMFWVVGSDADGREYTRFAEDADLCQERIDTLAKRNNVIDRDELAEWDVRAPYGTRAWEFDGCEEREIEDERDGMGYSAYARELALLETEAMGWDE